MLSAPCSMISAIAEALATNPMSRASLSSHSLRSKIHGRSNIICHRFDQVGIDPNLGSMPHWAFQPMPQRVFCQSCRPFHHAQAVE